MNTSKRACIHLCVLNTHYPAPTGEWSVPLGKFAERPDPLNCHCFVKFDSYRAVLFGGGYKGEKRNETRICNLTERVI